MKKPAFGVIVTVPPHASFTEEVARHPMTVGLRFNTVMPVKGSLEDLLRRLTSHGQPLWVDLKARQLRVAEAAVPPFTAVRLSHRIKVKTPARAVFSGGRETARVLEVDGDRLILEDGPRRVLGPGESVNIPCSSLEVEGVLTPRDEEYVAAARAIRHHDFMLSFAESEADVAAVKALDPQANVVAKIESMKGLAYARERSAKSDTRLMAARGDLFLEVRRPHEIVRALKDVVASDPDAIVASRICDSLAWSNEPSAQDISDICFLAGLGYRTLMLGDEVCMKRDSVISALNLLEALAHDLT